ncbi:MAG: hypothetical protein ACRDTA_02080 [Pseudonocardiaceae bacterium]
MDERVADKAGRRAKVTVDPQARDHAVGALAICGQALEILQ